MHVGETIKILLKKNRYKQADLATHLGITKPAITKLLDTRMPREETLANVASFFGMAVEEITGESQTDLAPTKQNKAQHGIPFYDVDVMAGSGAFPAEHSNPELLYYLPDFKDCTAIFPIYGDSMSPKFRSGDRVIVKEYLHFRDYIRFGEVFLVFTENEERMIKVVRKSEKADCIKLVSENQNYDPFDVPLHIITKMFIVKGRFSIENE